MQGLIGRLPCWFCCEAGLRGRGDRPSNSACAVPSGGVKRASCSDHCSWLHCYGEGRGSDPKSWPGPKEISGLSSFGNADFFIEWLIVRSFLSTSMSHVPIVCLTQGIFDMSYHYPEPGTLDTGVIFSEQNASFRPTQLNIRCTMPFRWPKPILPKDPKTRLCSRKQGLWRPIYTFQMLECVISIHSIRCDM